jgi:hypothetical protein
MSITPDQVKGELALELDAAKLSTADFLKAAEAFIGLIKEVSKSLDERVPGDGWEVSANEGSQVINIYPNLAKVPEQYAHLIAERVLDGISQIEQRAENPFGSSERAVEHIKTLGKIACRDKNHVPIRCLSRSTVRDVSRNVYKHASEILSWEYEDSGTVDGVLDVVSAHNGYEFRISEILHGKSVKCIVNEGLLKKALDNFQKRVEVDGLISYSKKGFPRIVKAKEIIPFPDKEDVPHFSELKGILAGIDAG